VLKQAWSALALPLLLWGCTAGAPEGLAPTPPGNGPQVIFDLDFRPFPEIPLPNDLGTRLDPDSPTGRRVNASLIGPTLVESWFRWHLDRLTGFSTFGPVSVRFDAPLDVHNIFDRHGADLGYADDAFYLINLDNGKPVPLDAGYNAFPYVLERPNRYYPNDPHAGESNLVYETINEDTNGNGELDPGEDLDSDGVLDVANTLDPGGDTVDNLITFYERETNTLVLRPLVPLDQETRYAVVLTRRLVGEQGQPVRSPFAYINHAQQTEALKPLQDILERTGEGLSLDDVAFCWSFTTQSITRDLEDLRMGLYGRGPHAFLADRFPPETILENAYSDPASAPINPFVVPAADAMDGLEPIAGALLGEGPVVDELLDSYRKYADYLVIGRAQVPVFMEGLYGAWELSEDKVLSDDLPWLIVIPKQRPEQGIRAPFPVAIYTHGTGGFRLESLGFAGQMAKFGIATVGVDLYMHGMVLPDDVVPLFEAAMQRKGLEPVVDSLLDNRAVDINNDGIADPAGTFWSFRAFHVRDSVRQAALDVIRMVHVLRGFDGKRTWSFDADRDGVADLEGLAGDFNNDGVVDLVGPDGPYFLFGISLGGIVGSVAAAMEPEIVAAAPISPGGGLVDVVMRSLQTGIPENVLLSFMGPLLIGTNDPDGGEPVLAFYIPNAWEETLVPVHSLSGLTPDLRMRLTNQEPQSGDQDFSRTDADLGFRLAVSADQGDHLAVEALDASGQVVWQADTFDRDVEWQGVLYEKGSPLVALADGSGIHRQSPDLRRFGQMAQTALDPGDPVNYAPYYFKKSLYQDYPGVYKPTNLALLLTAGDMNVPINTGIAEGLAAGLIPFEPGYEDPRYGRTPHRVLIDNWVAEGLERLYRFDQPPWNDPRRIIFDPDDLSEGQDGFDAPNLSPPLRLRTDGPNDGESVIRIFYMHPTGSHGIPPSDPTKTYNINLHAINAIAHYFLTRQWIDDTCLESDTCDFIPTE